MPLLYIQSLLNQILFDGFNCLVKLLSNHVLFYLFLVYFIFSFFLFNFLFQPFSSPPNVFVTAAHQIPKRPQDAMALWVEEFRVDNFKICLREAKIFDGPHKNIKIVSELAINFLLLDNL